MTRHVVSEDIIQMDWICSSCHHVNPGVEGEREGLRCAQCGQEKTDADPYVMPGDVEGAKALVGEMERRGKLGPNWECEWCHASSRADHDKCEVCGADKNGPPPAKPTPPPPVHSSPYVPPVMSTSPVPPPSGVSVPVSRLSDADPDMLPMRRWPEITFGHILGAALALAVLGGIVWAVWPRHTYAKVADIHWVRNEVLSERHDYTGTGWRTQAPNDVFEWSVCETRQRTTVSCNPHNCNCRPQGYDCNCSGGDDYRCNPYTVSEDCRCRSYDCRCSTSTRSNRNGSATRTRSCSTCRSCDTCTSTRYRTCTHPRVCSTCYRTVCDTCFNQCPVMDQWCTYRYHRWDQINTRTLDGHDHNPVWPGIVANGPLQSVARTETYSVRFREAIESDPQSWDDTVGAGEFTRYNVGQRWEVQFTPLGGVTPLHLMGANARP